MGGVSAARSRSRRSSPASPRWRRTSCAVRSSCASTVTTTFSSPAAATASTTRYEVGYDDDGRVLGAELTMVSRAGFSADLSAPVMTRAICHFDNAYWLPDVAIHGYSGRTNTQSNTAFPRLRRAAGRDRDREHPRLDRAPARPRSPRRAPRQLLRQDDEQRHAHTQVVEDNIIHELVAELEASSNYRARRAEVRGVQRASPVLKRGLALTPVKFGISFNVKHFNQAGALVHVYNDGSILVNHGGTEMGQGLNTKVAQVVAHELGVGFEHVRVTATDTQKVANTSATAASTGADLNGRRRRTRRARSASASPRALLRTTAAAGRALQRQGRGRRPQPTPFSAVVAQAYIDRDAALVRRLLRHARTALEPRDAAGQAVLLLRLWRRGGEVVVDTLTGESKLLRADLLHDVGRSPTRRSTSARSRARSSGAWAG